MAFTIRINDVAHAVAVDPEMPLLWVLRDELDLKGSKFGCGGGFCGACTVHVNGLAVPSCSVPVSAVDNANVTTIEGMADHPVGRHLQQVWQALDVPQCGYCQAGQMIMSAASLLSHTPRPTNADIDAAMSGNICRCATYTRIRQAIKHVAEAE